MAALKLLWDPTTALSDPSFVCLIALVLGLLLAAPCVIALVGLAGRLSPEDRQELSARYRSWLILASVIILPIILGRGATIICIALLSLMCYREFARVTGIFRHRRISIVITAGALGLMAAALSGQHALFFGLCILSVAMIPVVSLTVADQPGYLQRTALAVFGWILVVLLSHLGLLTERVDYRSVLLGLILCIELNDVFAYIFGRAIGGRKLCPQISPNKTAAGAFGALAATTALAVLSGSFVFAGDPIGTPLGLSILGLIISSTGQLGDLMLSAVKRDIGIKDTANLIPGHGGFLDRFDSLLLTAPIVFYVLQIQHGGIL
ncbi:MAG: phosphatidate cytidylyltransferase [Rhodothermales bacterium]|jgi:phosphatidate cytidylyltransferase